MISLDNQNNAFIKRVFDVVISVVSIVVFSPLMLIVAIIIKLDSKGNIIFKQARVGKDSNEFIMYKFRSMYIDNTNNISNSECTRIGSFLRKFSIDELPQLVNVLIGSMSIIGPRPEIPECVEYLLYNIPNYDKRLTVKPGMTGWAQIHGYRGNTSMAMRVEHDIFYIENWSIGLDLTILLKTCFKGFYNKAEI